MATKVAVLTGASYGIGPHIARRLVKDGYRVALAARSAEPLQALQRELGANAIAIPTDVTDSAARDALISRAESELGPIDVLINNAGIHWGGRFHQRSQDEIDEVLRTNIAAPIALTRAVLPKMLERKSGHIIQVASLAGKVAMPFFSIYAATKHALIGFVHSLESELHGTGVHVSAVCPGFIKGDGMWARTGRPAHVALGISSPERVAEAVAKTIQRPSTVAIVNPMPVRAVMALWGIAPGIAAAVYRMMGITRFFRDAALQVERDVPSRAR